MKTKEVIGIIRNEIGMANDERKTDLLMYFMYSKISNGVFDMLLTRLGLEPYDSEIEEKFEQAKRNVLRFK